MKKVIFILGPTAVGKTFFSVKLAKEIDGEIISSDSVQIYKGLDVGSAKVTQEEMQGVVHYAIDILEPEEEFSVFDYVQYTRQKIDEITAKGKVPIVVGGTGLYVRALTEGYNFGGAAKDEELRSHLENLAKEKGNDFLFEMLKDKNPEMAEKTDKANTVRLVRALEIALSDGEKTKSEVDIDPLVIALKRAREKLYFDINRRADIMIENGLIAEVEGLLKRGLTLANQSMRGIGYKEVVGYLQGEYDYDRMIEILKQHCRNYAKRQLTFLRGMDNVNFVEVEDREKAFEEILALANNFLNKK
ncbi:MAG: tRNA (adenosine(37)-N6)-dimethylallyltransferase MiaA [Clostridia bacterium]|nr:tRNA (adenosine(37)-N6)-dimethylallyltransferase MiaA [Clostridia bacterium]